MAILRITTFSKLDLALISCFIAIICGLMIGLTIIFHKISQSQKISFFYIFKRSALFTEFAISIIILTFTIIKIKDWYTKAPTTLTQKELIGSYEIDTTYFKGKNAKWQYSRYQLKIGAKSISLKIIENGRLLNEIEKPINNITIENRAFFTFHGDYYSDLNFKIEPRNRFYQTLEDSIHQVKKEKLIQNDTLNHHMLRLNPSLLLSPHSFRVVLYSTKYKNMYFKKIKA